ncbi:MAG: MotA/TolQ/ExbB proton channel family protein [Candidatus Porifericomitaceae bacterium WSBS_2022_MAG_OTU9]
MVAVAAGRGGGLVNLAGHLMAAAWFCLLSVHTVEVFAEAATIDDLLLQVKTGRIVDADANEARMRQFSEQQASQSELLAQAGSERDQALQLSEQLEQAFADNEKAIAELEQTFTERLGDLKELFGILQQVAGDARGQFEDSLVSVQYPDRGEFLTDFAQEMGRSTSLVSIADIERLWFELQREMTESGKLAKFTALVVAADGEEFEEEVTRIGVFNVLANGKYLNYIPETGRLMELPRQPPQRFLEAIQAYATGDAGLLPLAVDPSRGQVLSLLVRQPSLEERIHQGGEVGYIIIALGIVALVVAFLRMLILYVLGLLMWRQARMLETFGNNPLGRVFKVYKNNSHLDVATLELKLGEAILKERPKFNKMHGLLKIIAVVAPLMGLLGTVTGMIITFQSITLFGTGDPRLMAGGISQALVTTVLGLCVAIPTVLLHALVSAKARQLGQVLEEQAAGMIATRSEAIHKESPAPPGPRSGLEQA